MRFFITVLVCLLPFLGSSQNVALNTEYSFNGYTLFCPLNSTTTYLIDNCGNIINTWSSSYNPGLSVYLLPDGSLLHTCKIDIEQKGGRIERFNWEGDLIWEFDFCEAGNYCQHHDIEFLPNGNILILSSEFFSSLESQDAGFDNPTSIISEMIIEIDPLQFNSVVWEWHAWDHLTADNPELNPELIWTGLGNQSVNAWPTDWLHANSVSYNYELDQIALSLRSCNEFWVIDHSTTPQEAYGSVGGNSGKGGDLLYRWGNPVSYGMGGVEDQRLFGQHDVHWISSGNEDEGDLIIFNNGASRGWSSIDVLTPPIDSDGNYIINPNEVTGPTSLNWTYAEENLTDFFSSHVSGATRQPNGNTLICEGNGGRLFEVDLNGNKVWEFHYENGNIFRAYRYGEDFEGFEGRDMTPGENISSYPNACNLYSGTDDLEGEGDMFYSYPNPVSDFLTVDLGGVQGVNASVKMYDVSSKLVFEKLASSSIVIDVSDYAEGLYTIEVSTEERVLRSKVVVE
jgi:hypothetical protein